MASEERRGELGLLSKAWRRVTGLFGESERPQARRRGLGRLVRLEDRALLSATAVDPQIQEALAASKPAQAQPEQMITRHEVAFVDSAVHEFESLIEQLNRQESNRQLDIVVLDKNRDGIEQITQALAGYQNLDAVHFLSHGRDGAARLGSTVLDGNSLHNYTDAIQAWKASLSADADLLFYGCNIAEGAAGQAFLNSIAGLTDADVAASTDITGHQSKDGDWDLEFSFGAIDTQVPLDAAGQDAWNSVLAPPTAVDDSYSVDEDGTLNVSAPGVLGNDSDPDLDPLTAILVSGPSNGNLNFNSDGSFIYTPDLNFFGTDTFTYKANDGLILFGDSNVATVTITVNSVNDVPVAVNDSYSTNEDVPLNVAAGAGVLANDTDPDNVLTAILVSGPSNGILVLNPNGSFTYTPFANFNGADSFTYKANDGTVDSNIATVTLTINAVNDPPVANNDSYSTNEDTPLIVAAPGVLTNDGDPVEGSPLTAALFTGASNGLVVLNADGSFSYTPNANFSGTDSFTYRAHDGQSNSGTATVTITVNAINDAPVNAMPGAQSVNEDAVLTLSGGNRITINDVDAGGSDELLITLTSGNGVMTLAGTGGLTFITGDGTADSTMVFTGRRNDINSAFNGMTFTPTLNYFGATTITITTDDQGNTGGGGAQVDTDVLNITVNSVNDPPVAVDDSYSVNEDGSLNVAAAGVLSNDSDPIEGSPLTAALVSTTSNGALTLNPDGSFTYTPNANFVGTDSFVYRANDGTSNSNNATVTITVNAVNDAPVNSVPGPQTTNEDTQLIFSAGNGNLISINDIDAASGPMQLTLTVTNGVLTLGGTAGLTFSTGDGTNDATMIFTGTRTNINTALNGLRFTPNTNFNGTATLFVLTDDQGNTGSGGALTDTDSVVITVNPVNDAPVAVNDGYSVNEDGSLNIAAAGVLTNDTDVEGSALTAALVSTTSNGLLSLNPDGSFTYTPNANFNGSDSFTYRANDGTANSNVATVTITVNPVNDAPVATGDSYSVNEDNVLNVGAPGVLSNDTDIDPNPLTAVLVSGTSNGALNLNANGSFSYTPNLNFNGTDSFTYRANDGTANSNVVTVTITVNAVNDAPVAVADSYSVNEDGTLIIAASGVLGNDTDVEGSPLTAALVAVPSNGAVVLNTDGSFTYIANANFTGTDSFTYQANDGSLDSNVATVTITVNPINDAPVHTVPQTQVTLRNTALLFSTANANPITVADDSGASSIRVTLTVANGTLTLSQTTGLSFTTGDGTADATMVFTGSQANIDAALEGMTYTPTTGYTGVTTLQITTNDLGNTGAGGPLSTSTSIDIEVVVEFIVNTTLTAAQTLPATAMDPLGNFVVVWTTDASGSPGVRGQRFDANGTPQGPQIQVNQITANDQTNAAIAMAANGSFVAVFASKDTDGSGWGIYAQRFTAAGAYIGPEFRVNTTTNGNQDFPAIAMDSAGSFVVVWQSDRGGTGKDIYFQRYDANGNAQGGEVRANVDIIKDQDRPVVAMDQNGNFVVVWRSTNGDGSGAGVFGRAFNAAGAPLTGDFQVNTTNSGSQEKPTIAMAPNGDFVVAWVSGNNQDGNGKGVFAQRFAANTTKLGGEFQVNTYTNNDQDWPSVAMDGAGNFTITWQSKNQDGSDKGVYSQKYDALGNTIGLETRLNATTDKDQHQLSAALSTFGDYIVVWQGKGPGDDTGIFGFHVRSDNDAPVNSMPGNQTTNEDTPLTFSTANGNVISIADADSGNYPMQVTLTVTNGTLTLNGTAGLTFTTGDGTGDATMVFTGSQTAINTALNGLVFAPNLNWNGFSTLTITSNDQGSTGQGGPMSDTDVVSIGVNPVNDAPVAVGDAYTVNEDATSNVAAPGVLANDSDIDNNPLTAILVSGPTNGTLNLNADGSFSYTPNAGFNGADSFTYKANDGFLDSNVVTVNLTVTAVNDAPVNSLPAAQSPNEDTTLVFSVAGGNAISISDVDMAAGQARVTLTVTNGTLTLGGLAGLSFTIGDGVSDVTMTFTGTIANINAALNGATYSPNLNFNGLATLTITTNDLGNTGIGGPQSDTDVLNINVVPVNDAPVASGESYSTNEDTPLAVAAPGVVGNDTDVEGTPLSAVLVSGPANGNLVLNADGSFLYTPNLNYFGADSFTYKANDGGADSNIVTVTLTINPVNDAPVAAADSYATNEDTTLTILAPGVLSNDTDVESSPLTASLIAGPANGVLTFNVNGSFVYTPNLNFNGADTFTYRANDGTANSNVATVTIIVNPVNDAPVAVAESYTVNEDTPLVVALPGVLTNDSDIDLDSLAAVLVSGTSNGVLALNANGSFVYTANANYFGADSFQYKANDGAADSNIVTVNITINAVNDAPVAIAETYVTDEDNTLVVAVPGFLANDTDIESSPLFGILVSGTTNGLLNFNASGWFTYTPNLNFNGIDFFSYRANDGTADSNVATVTIVINAVNDAPVALGNSYTLNEDTPLTVAVAGVLGDDSDVEATPLTAAVVTGPSAGTLSFAADGSFVYTPNADFNGSDSFTYKANDGAADSNIATVNFAINAVNDRPVRLAGSTSNLIVMQGSGLHSLGLGSLDYSPGGGADEAGQVISFVINEVPDSAIGDVVLADGTTVVTAGSTYTLGELQGMQFRTSTGGIGGPLTFSFAAQDDGGVVYGGVDMISESLTIQVQPTPPASIPPAPPAPGPVDPDPIEADDTTPPADDNDTPPEDETSQDEEVHTTPVPQKGEDAIEVANTTETRVVMDKNGGAMMVASTSPRRGYSSGEATEFSSFDMVAGNALQVSTHGSNATHLGVGISSTNPFAMSGQFFWNQLSELAQQFEPETWNRMANVTFLTGVTMSAGYLFWNMRTWYLLASLLLSKPLWQEFDHMAVLDTWYKNPKTRRLLGIDEEDDEQALDDVME